MAERDAVINFLKESAQEYLSPYRENNVYVTRFDQNYALKNIESLISGSHPVLQAGKPRPTPYDMKTGWVIGGINGVLLDIEAKLNKHSSSAYLSDKTLDDEKLSPYAHGNPCLCALQNKYRAKTKEERSMYSSNVCYEEYICASQIEEKALYIKYPHFKDIEKAYSQYVKENSVNYVSNREALGDKAVHASFLENVKNTSTPKLSHSIYTYMLCQKTGKTYVPPYTQDEILKETAIAIKKDPKAIYNVFQKASYYADVSATRVCSKELSYVQGQTRQASYYSEMVKQEKSLELSAGHSRR